jgi:hypothetical protein
MKFEYYGKREQTPPLRLTGVKVYRKLPIVARPIIPVRVVGPRGHEDLMARLDTGADDTILPGSYVDRLGIVLEGTPVEIAGVGGPAFFRHGRAVLELRKGRRVVRWAALVGFWLDDNRAAVLGLAGFLEYFSANFNGEHEHIKLDPNRNLPATTGPVA